MTGGGEQLRFPAPIEGEVWLVPDFVLGRGTWSPYSQRGKCEECMRCIYLWLRDLAPDGVRAPGLARNVMYRRMDSGGKSTFFCGAHAQRRQEKEKHDG